MLCRCSADKIHSQSQRPKFKISTTSESQKFNIAGTKPNKEHACVGSAPGAEMLGLHGQSTGLTSAHQTMAGQRCCHSWSSCHRKAACSPLHLLGLTVLALLVAETAHALGRPVAPIPLTCAPHTKLLILFCLLLRTPVHCQAHTALVL